MTGIYALGDLIPFEGTTWRVIGTRGIPGATQAVDLRDTADGRNCQAWKASILTDLVRRGW